MFKKAGRAVVTRLENDIAAFIKIYDRYRRSIYLISIRYLKDQQLAEDAVQNTLIKLWISKGRLNPDKPFRNYLFTSVRYHALNMIRSQKRRILEACQLKETRDPSATCTEDSCSISGLRLKNARSVIGLSLNMNYHIEKLVVFEQECTHKF